MLQFISGGSRGAKGAMPPKPTKFTSLKINFCVSQKISARSARSIVLYRHSFTLKMVVSTVIGIVQYA